MPKGPCSILHRLHLRIGLPLFAAAAALVPLSRQAAAADPAPRIKLVLNEDQTGFSHLSWDTEGGSQADQNLLRGDAPAKTLATRLGNDVKPAGTSVRMAYEPAAEGFDLVLSLADGAPATSTQSA